LHALLDYCVYMKSMQYTIRQIPSQVDDALRKKARTEGRSLNEIAVEAITMGAGLAETPIAFHDLDSLIGTWKADPEFDEIIRAQDQVDPHLWSRA
jgi:hypothetical protein